MEQPPTFLRSNFLKRQDQERRALEKMYEIMEPLTEYKAFGANKVSEPLGLTTGTMGAIARNLETIGILERRLEFGAMINDKYAPGRSYHWRLALPKDEAMAKLEAWQQEQRKLYDRPPKRRERKQSGKINQENVPTEFQEGSLKERIFKAVQTFEEFSTFDQLFTIIRRRGENLDYHSVTHVLNSLQQEGKVTFTRGSGSSAARTPRNIKLTKTGARGNDVEQVARSFMPSPEIVEAAKKLAEKPAGSLNALNPVVVDDLSTPDEAQAAIDAGNKILAKTQPEPEQLAPEQLAMEQDLRFRFPLISKLSKRKETLLRASDMVEDLEQEIAILLLEAAGKPMSEVEEEAVKLFKDYQECIK